jgi:hypothetical protein
MPKKTILKKKKVKTTNKNKNKNIINIKIDNSKKSKNKVYNKQQQQQPYVTPSINIQQPSNQPNNNDKLYQLLYNFMDNKNKAPVLIPNIQQPAPQFYSNPYFSPQDSTIQNFSPQDSTIQNFNPQDSTLQNFNPQDSTKHIKKTNEPKKTSILTRGININELLNKSKERGDKNIDTESEIKRLKAADKLKQTTGSVNIFLESDKKADEKPSTGSVDTMLGIDEKKDEKEEKILQEEKKELTEKEKEEYALYDMFIEDEQSKKYDYNKEQNELYNMINADDDDDDDDMPGLIDDSQIPITQDPLLFSQQRDEVSNSI